MMQYMMDFPRREFKNNIGQGPCHNLKESLYALFGISGFESKLNTQESSSSEGEDEPLN